MTTSTQFGQQFRQHRESLGLSLREFCRRNGFDPGNISKLERGLLVPPRTNSTLEPYAKALGLATDSLEWEKLFQLARADSGAKLSQPSRVVQHSTWTQAITLDQWADTLGARSTLPLLLRRLVHATVGKSHLVQIKFPARENIQNPGWDGIVATTEGNAYVPVGLSAWEISTEKQPKRKADADFQKRTSESLEVEKEQAAFVFVTPRKWPGKDKWCAEKKALGRWKDVRVYDAETLEAWLEIAKGVDVWMARILGNRPDAVDDIDTYWHRLSNSTNPPLPTQVFLTSRDENIQQLTSWYKSLPSVLSMESPSPRDVIDFVAACYAHWKDDAPVKDIDPDDFAAKTLFISSLDAWRNISASHGSLLLLPAPDLPLEQEAITEAVQNGHHVLLASHRFPPNRDIVKYLRRPDHYDLKTALSNSDLNEKDANSHAHNSGGSLTVLKRKLSRNPLIRRPEWTKPENAREIIPFILLGSWVDTRKADRQALEKLSDKSYEENLQVLHRWLDTPDPPVMKVLTEWSMVSHEDSWQLLAPHITDQDLQKFQNIATEILQEVDPQYELPTQNRLYAAMNGKVLEHSFQIRSGICETLALLGCKSHDEPIQGLNPEQVAEDVVSSLLNPDTSWKQWASLTPLLPVLAESSPNGFLQSVEDDLKSNRLALQKLFIETGDDIFANRTHTGLLWALETLAWHPKHLTQVTFALARLHEIALQGKWSNSPLNNPLHSLIEIFLPWKPGTTATVVERIKALEKMMGKHEGVAWGLLCALLPSMQSISMPTPKPLWLDWSLNWDHATTRSEWREQINACSDLLLGMLGSDVERHLQLINNYGSLPRDAKNQLLSSIKGIDLSKINSDDRIKISDAIRDLQNNAIFFNNDKWDVSDDTIEQLQKRFEPDDAIDKNLWLFKYMTMTSHYPKNLPKDKIHDAIDADRGAALQEIYHKNGISGVMELAQKSAFPRLVGEAYAKSNLYKDEDPIIPKELGSDGKKHLVFARAVAGTLFKQRGWEWVKKLPLEEWSSQEAGIFLSALQPWPEPKIWLLAEKLNAAIEKAYWTHVGSFRRLSNLTDDDIVFVIKKFMKHERTPIAVDSIYSAIDEESNINPSIVVEVLNSITASNINDVDMHAIEDLILYLQQEHKNTDIEELEKIERKFLLPLSSYNDLPPVALNKKLQRDPKYYSELIRIVFRSDDELERPNDTPSQQEKDRAHNAHHLLSQWYAIPGMSKEGTIDERKLLDWVCEAREICANTGHLNICDVFIGKMLAKEPETDRAFWPSEAIRDVIDEINSDSLTNGFRAETFNKRGVYTKVWGEGGLQEWSLAEKYQAYAKNCEIEWPVTAKALGDIAKGYERRAKTADEKAKANRR